MSVRKEQCLPPISRANKPVRVNGNGFVNLPFPWDVRKKPRKRNLTMMDLVSSSFPSLAFPIKERHPDDFLTPHIIQSWESAVGFYFVWVYFALGGSVPVHKSHILQTSPREAVVLTAAPWHRVKWQDSDLTMHVLAHSHSWPRLSLLTHLPLGSHNVFLEYAPGGNVGGCYL